MIANPFLNIDLKNMVAILSHGLYFFRSPYVNYHLFLTSGFCFYDSKEFLPPY